MTDITELAQSLKAAAEKYKSVWGIARYSKAVEAREKFHELVTAANVIALVEALEKAQQRIAELESRTVKLPDLRQIVSGDRYVWSDGVYNYSQDVKVALAAAGIKVEAE
ncbi:hypothetical protein QMN75_19815 [Klebsiella pneumoniae]|nr:hypothetical protein [Klebsiella pneumoniae]MDI6982502.1 hypothetical protein [Klebsiella pneumoniae]